MPAAENTVVINRPRPEVFAFVADHENDPRWRSGVVDIKRASGEGQGAIYTQGVKGPMAAASTPTSR
ncbi:MAG TPA: SRPBCC family protein [Gaiellaceae bacterium]|nr:SRPBCC family protein [Gaiellaceae bacterium]